MSDDGARRQSAPAILTLIAADIANFALFFGYFMVERAQAPDVFARSAATLDVRLGLLNTAILVTSGWLVALAVEAARRGQERHAARLVALSVAVGAGFLLVKAVEYWSKIRHGFTPNTNTFFQLYFGLTGLHLAHYLIGMALLGVCVVRLGRGNGGVAWLESCGLFWHMVDVLWVFLFALLYLQGEA